MRLRVKLTAPRLDAALAANRPPAGEAGALRAEQLCSEHVREHLAQALDGVCRQSATRKGRSASIPVSGDGLELARPALRSLSQTLRAPGPHAPRGVALTRLILTEANSPLYRPTHPTALYKAARAALLALVPSARAAVVPSASDAFVSSADAEPYLIGGR